MEAVGNAERERAAAPDEVPLGEWEAVRVRPDCNVPLISQALLANAEEAKSLLQVPLLAPTLLSTPLPSSNSRQTRPLAAAPLL